MTTTLQKWGNSQGLRLPKALLKPLGLENGSSVEVRMTPKQDAIIVKPVKRARPVRGRHRLEDLVAAMPRRYRSEEFSWDQKGREVW